MRLFLLLQFQKRTHLKLYYRMEIQLVGMANSRWYFQLYLLKMKKSVSCKYRSYKTCMDTSYTYVLLSSDEQLLHIKMSISSISYQIHSWGVGGQIYQSVAHKVLFLANITCNGLTFQTRFILDDFEWFYPLTLTTVDNKSHISVSVSTHRGKINGNVNTLLIPSICVKLAIMNKHLPLYQ